MEKMKIVSCQVLTKFYQKFVQTGGKTVLFDIHRLTNSIWNKKEFSKALEWICNFTYL